MATDFFYSELPALKSFWEISNPLNFVPVPEDWYILITDVKNSTEAIARGNYKTINLLGASSIIAVLNVAGGIEVPFVFGGDGATVLVPPSLMASARDALLATQQVAQQEFGMELRVGVVPVSVVAAHSYAVTVAKVQISKHYTQANFSGGGLTFATELVKDDRPDNPYQIQASCSPSADFSGLECRWQDIPCHTGQALSLILAATTSGSEPAEQIYERAIATIRTIYQDDQSLHPVRLDGLNLCFNPRQLALETRLQTASTGFWSRLRYLLLIELGNLLGLLFIRLRITLDGTNWGQYKTGVLATTDYRKFDDVLRMVIASTPEQTQQLTRYLEQEFRAGSLVYGLHQSDRVLMTCLIFERSGRQVHFIDGADGGYAIAARAMKQRLQHKVNNWKTYNRMLHFRNQVKIEE